MIVKELHQGLHVHGVVHVDVLLGRVLQLGDGDGLTHCREGQSSGQQMSLSIPSLDAQGDRSLCSMLTMSLGPVENAKAWQHGKDPPRLWPLAWGTQIHTLLSSNVRCKTKHRALLLLIQDKLCP